jgi:hypothetical protein
MPRFVGNKTTSVWLNVLALIVLVVVVVIVLSLTGIIDLFGS